MQNDPNIELLRECGKGALIGAKSIADVQSKTDDEEFRSTLSRFRMEHEMLASEIWSELSRHGEKPGDPPRGALWMSGMKTGATLAFNEDDNIIAELMLDGCLMGMRSLAKKLNRAKNAGDTARSLTERLIALDEAMAHDMLHYL